MTHSKTWSWQLEERIASDSRQGVRVIRTILDALAELGWTERELFGVHLALEEAVMNAIKHGNALDPAKTVHVVARASPHRTSVKITDQGSGFDPSTVPDPTLEENLLKTTGRGVMLMRHYMTSVRYNRAGNSVELKKNRGR
jgi:serine/threonine-protein kinase RsbW